MLALYTKSLFPKHSTVRRDQTQPLVIPNPWTQKIAVIRELLKRLDCSAVP
jgi:hypothetical protein